MSVFQDTLIRCPPQATLGPPKGESDVGAKVGDLARDLNVFLSNANRRSFRFIDQPYLSLFNLRVTDGQLSVAQRIDREQLCRRSQYCVIPLDVVAVHQEKSFLMHVEVDIRDINDNAPKFPVHEMYVETLESASEGTRFPLEVATDEDIGRNYIQSYTISTNEYFIVEARSGEGGLYAELVLVKELDREKEDTYNLEITAMDEGIPILSGILTVKIKVLDINDNTPAFEDSFIKITLSESARVGLLLLHLRASDPDEGQNGEVVYGFEEKTPLEIKQIFNIDPHIGRLTLAREVDYEKNNFFDLKIIAYDMGINSVPAQCTVRVDILDANDNAPLIIIKSLDFDSVTYIAESAPVNSFVALVSTMDRDSGVNGHVHCNLLGHQHFRLQHAYEHTFMIVTTSFLDRETLPEYNLTAVATDHGTPPLTTIMTFSIQLRDVNDNPPEFTKSLYEVWIEENNLPGAFLFAVSVVATVLIKLMRRRGSYSTNSSQDKCALSEMEDIFEAHSNTCAPFLGRRRETLSHENEFCNSFFSVFLSDAQTEIIMPCSTRSLVDPQPFDLHRKYRAGGTQTSAEEDMRISTDPTGGTSGACLCPCNQKQMEDCVQSAHRRLDFSSHDNTDKQCQQSPHQQGKIYTKEHTTRNARGVPCRKKNYLFRTKIPKTKGLLQVIPRSGLPLYPEYEQSSSGSCSPVSLVRGRTSTAL
ncbi:protocadherin-18-like [Alosa pseudoharengus]|uniref:protocadherin-18-like n=1 Tax=Alosa pseudoharengus TaxID=34774 RepID=UPI003F8BD3EA